MILELFQETDIVFIQQTHVVNFIFQQGDPLQAHAEGKTGIFLRVDIAHLQNVGMHHAAA